MKQKVEADLMGHPNKLRDFHARTPTEKFLKHVDTGETSRQDKNQLWITPTILVVLQY